MKKNKFHVSKNLFEENSKNVFHPESDRRLGEVLKDNKGNTIARNVDDNQLLMFSDEPEAMTAFSGMSKRKKREQKTDAWSKRMNLYHKNFKK